MYRKLPESSGNVLGYSIEGRLTQESVEKMQAEMSVAMDQHGSLRLLVVTDRMDEVEPSAVWQDLKMTPDYVRNIDRLAVVGDARWQEWAAKLADTFAEAEFFAPEDIQQAWDWVREDASATSGTG